VNAMAGTALIPELGLSVVQVSLAQEIKIIFVEFKLTIKFNGLQTLLVVYILIAQTLNINNFSVDFMQGSKLVLL